MLEWDFYSSLFRRYYQLDIFSLTLDETKRHIQQLPKVRKWEAGEDPNADPTKALTAEEYAQAVARGEITPELGPKKQQKKINLTPEQRRAEEARIRAMFTKNQEEPIREKLPTYGGGPLVNSHKPLGVR